MAQKYGVLYCRWDNKNVIKFSEIIEAENVKEAIEKTDRNLEMNVVIPLTNENVEHLKKLINLKPKIVKYIIENQVKGKEHQNIFI